MGAPHIRKDLTGAEFGLLAVMGKGSGPKLWQCLCECGELVEVRRGSLTRGLTRSCGCLRRATTAANNFKHGGASSDLYAVWAGMWARCTNANSPAYKNYGGRGIAVCARWRDFDAFVSDMGQRPAGATLERKENNGPYAPNNCVWATRLRQANNTRANVLLEAGGVTETMADFARTHGLNYYTLRGRIRAGLRALGGINFTVKEPAHAAD